MRHTAHEEGPFLSRIGFCGSGLRQIDTRDTHLTVK
jgi:LysR family transcriptional regulator, glycine cleavage system transcriptional activator